MTTAPLQCSHTVLLHIQDGLLAKEDKKLPFARHIASTLQQLHFVKNFIVIMFVGTQKVIVGNPESQVIVGTFDVVKAVCFPIGSFIRTVQPFHDLFEWTVFFGYSIVVGKSNDLGDRKGKVFSKLLCELHCGKRVSAVAVRNKLKVFRQFFKTPESHAHSEDTGAHATVIGYLVADNGTAGGVHNEPDVSFDAADFDIGFIGDKCCPLMVGILVNKRFDADSSGFTVIGDLLMGDADVIEILKSLAGFTKRQAEVDMQRQTQGHNVCVMLTEFQGRSVLRKGAYIHAEKIYRELPVDIVKLIFIFSVTFFQIGFVHFLKVVEIVGAFWIDTFVENEMLSFFFRY